MRCVIGHFILLSIFCGFCVYFSSPVKFSGKKQEKPIYNSTKAMDWNKKTFEPKIAHENI